MRLKDNLEIVLQISKLTRVHNSFFELLNNTPYKKQLRSNEQNYQHTLSFINADTHKEIARLEFVVDGGSRLIFPN